MKKSDKRLVPVGTMVMVSGVGTTTGPFRIVRYLPDHRVRVQLGGVIFDVSLSRVILPASRAA